MVLGTKSIEFYKIYFSFVMFSMEVLFSRLFLNFWVCVFFLLLNLFRLEISFTPFLICFFFFQFVIKFLIYSLFNLISLAVAWVDDGYHFCLSCIFQRTIIDDGFLCNYVCVWRRKKESFALCVILSCFHRYKFRSAHWIGYFRSFWC